MLHSMTWHVQYRQGTTDHIVRHPSPERAIEAACGLIDDGCDVFGIGTGELTDSIGKETIARIYDMRVRAKLGGAVIQRLHAQATPPVYVVVDIADITDPEGFKAVPLKSGPETLAPFGGKYVIRTEKITPLDGTAPKRFVVIAFDNVERAKAWKASASSNEVDVIRDKTTKSIQFLVEGM